MIIVIGGQTATGKSELGISLAKEVGGVIINGDAYQIYTDFNIGTAKPSKEEREEVPHLLYDYLSPLTPFSIADYQKLLRSTIEKILKDNKIPIIVGGSGLYIKSALYDYEFSPTEQEYPELEKLSNQELFDMLKKMDEKESNKIHINNRKRLIRAITICRNINGKKSELVENQKHLPIFKDTYFIGLEMDREELYQKINNRVDLMIKEGLEKEVEELKKKYPTSIQAFQAIGYKEFLNISNREEAIEVIKKNSRNYAKRQMTFFKNQFDMHWFNCSIDAIN